jgi:hypothetical protein
MRRVSFAKMDCPVARSLDVIGEWWTLLIVRDAIRGARRFEDFKSTGIADTDTLPCPRCSSMLPVDGGLYVSTARRAGIYLPAGGQDASQLRLHPRERPELSRPWHLDWRQCR